MAFSILQGDPHELEAQAAALGSAASTLDHACSQIGVVRSAAAGTGTNALSGGIVTRTQALEPLLRLARDDMRKAQATLLALQHDLVALDAQARIAQQQADTARQHALTMPAALIHQHHADQLRGDANIKRAVAARVFEDLARDVPAYRDAHPEWWRRFGRDIKQMGVDMVSSTVDLAKAAAALSPGVMIFQLARDPQGFVDHWKGVFATADTLAHHKTEAAKAVLKAVVRPDLLQDDPLAWIVHAGSMVAGGAVLKVPRFLAAGAKAGEAATAVAGAGAAGRAAVDSYASGRALLQAGFPAGRISVLSDEARAVTDGAWTLTPFERGLVHEDGVLLDLHDANATTAHLEALQHNHKTIDTFDFVQGGMNSVKSIDPTAASYQRTSQFTATVNGNLRALDTYSPIDGRILGLQVQGWTLDQRTMTLLIPGDGLSAQQAQSLRVLHDRWITPQNRDTGTVLNIVVAP